MNKTSLVDIVAQNTGLKKREAEAAVNAVLQAITDDLATGGKVQLAGFGTFKVREKGERKGRNPKTGEEIVISASRSIVFTPGKTLKDAANNGTATE